MIATRIAAGRLHPLLRGVFAVGHRVIGRQGEMQAALLACGDGAVVSHGGAAELLGLWRKQPVLIDVTSSRQAGREIDGVRWHRSAVAEDEVDRRDGIPCTSVARTLADLAGRVGDRSLRGLVEQAVVLRLLDVEGVDRVLARTRRRGAPRLRAILEPWRDFGEERPRLRSVLEAKLLAAIINAGLPAPECNVTLQLEGHRIEVDFLWAEQRAVVETDGAETHGTSVAFRRDRWRDQVLTAAGYRAIRVTWDQLEDEEVATLHRIGRMLEAPGEGLEPSLPGPKPGVLADYTTPDRLRA
jgi:very-short-patch-repair endonuclease